MRTRRGRRGNGCGLYRWYGIVGDDRFARIRATFAWTFFLTTVTIPLALVAFRVDVAHRLLDGGNVSVCDAWSGVGVGGFPTTFPVPERNRNGVPVGAGGGSNSSNDAYLQCDLPPQLLPVSLAAATFMRFPPGTRILYHPPGVNRTVPFAASRAARADGTCSVARNAVIADDDAGHN